MEGNKKTEYICSYCGKKEVKSIGRPAPGNCPRKVKNRDGSSKPHSWVINRKLSW